MGVHWSLVYVLYKWCDSYRQARTQGHHRDSQHTTVYKQQQTRRVTKSFLLYSGAKQAWTQVQCPPTLLHLHCRVCPSSRATYPESNRDCTNTNFSSTRAAHKLRQVNRADRLFLPWMLCPLMSHSAPAAILTCLYRTFVYCQSWGYDNKTSLNECNRRCLTAVGETALQTPKVLHCFLNKKMRFSYSLLETRMFYRCSQ